MIPVDNFYNALYANLLIGTRIRYFLNFTDDPEFHDLFYNESFTSELIVMFYDQEPLLTRTLDKLYVLNKNKPKIIANSEHSMLKNDWFSKHGIIDWYYFYHGFAALDWYRDYKYFPKVPFKFDKVFMSLNHLVTRDRSYRLTLVANYIVENIVDHGIVSLPLKDVNDTVQGELTYEWTRLSNNAKQLIKDNIIPLQSPLIADTEFPHGAMSAATDFDFQRKAFWHVVAETVFYHKKLHLTEKIFKPIIARRPFLLVAAPGNLAYLKSYGFKTFSKWVDESYDNEQDDDKRIAMVVAQLKKLCKMNKDELYYMQQEMDEILDYNFNHFYGKFKEIIIDEMLINFEKAVRSTADFPVDSIDFDAVKKRFMQ